MSDFFQKKEMIYQILKIVLLVKILFISHQLKYRNLRIKLTSNVLQ